MKMGRSTLDDFELAFFLPAGVFCGKKFNRL